MISEQELELELDWMRDNADAAAAAAAEVIRAEEDLKSTLALVASASTAATIAAQEREARASVAVRKAIEERVAAVYADRKFRLRYAAAEARIEAWRTQQANARAEGKAYS